MTRNQESDRSTVTRRRLLQATGALGAIALAGCTSNPWDPASDIGTDSPSSDGEADSNTESDDAGGQNSSSDDETGGEGDDGTNGETPPPDLIVEIAPDGFSFDPSSFEIDTGDTVRWVWKDAGHNLRVRSKPDDASWTGTPGSGSDTYDEGYEHTYTFDTPGEYVYFCAPHQSIGLEGAFTVHDS